MSFCGSPGLLVCEESNAVRDLRTHVEQSQELRGHLTELQRNTEQEISSISQQLGSIVVQCELLSCELADLERQHLEVQSALQRNQDSDTRATLLQQRRELQICIAGRAAQRERVCFREQALRSLQSILSADVHRYQQEAHKLHLLSHRAIRSMPGESQHELDHMDSLYARSRTAPALRSEPLTNGHAAVTTRAGSQESTGSLDDEDRRWRASKQAASSKGTSLTRSGSVKDLIHKFSVPESPISLLETFPSGGPLSGKAPVVEPLSRAEPEKPRGAAELSRPAVAEHQGGKRESSPPEHQHQGGKRESSPPEHQHQGGKTESSPPEHQHQGGKTESSPPEHQHQGGKTERSPPEHQHQGGKTERSPPEHQHQGGKTESSPPEHQGGKRESSPLKSSIPPVATMPLVTPVTVTVTPPTEGSPHTAKQSVTTGPSSGAPATSGLKVESSFDSNKQPGSPSSTEDEAAPGVKPAQNPKYQLYMSGDPLGNGTRDPDRLARENGLRAASHLEGGSYRGSTESLHSRDWDITSDRVPGYESPPPRVFNSPYTSSLDAFKPTHRVSEYKVQDGLSTVPSDYSFGLNGHSINPLMANKMQTLPRARYTTTFDTLTRSRREREGITNHVPLRVGTRDKRDFIEELTRQLEEVQRRNQFLEAESIELDKERNQIRFEMRALLVAKEDLVCHNAKLQLDMKAMRERNVEVESNHNVMVERFRQMEGELKEAREVMIEANNQEYAFNFLQQSLKNKIQDAEEALEKQTLHAQAVSEKLWQAERRLEELEVDTESRGKKNSELNSTVMRLEAELSDALLSSSQAGADLSLQQKLRADAQLRVEELEESLLEKDQEMFRLQEIISRLQGEVSGKLSDKEQSLEDEIQLRERIQLQCKQAERHVEDLQMELQTSKQAKEDLAKQLKTIQERVIDLEVDLEDVHDSEQRWAAKHKKSIEQTEQLQLKLIQEKDLSEQLECEKAILERQVKELRSEVDELLNSKVQEDVISRAESKVKELESSLRSEERNKNSLTNAANKLERRINELTDQMEEEQKSFTEQKDLMTQRMRSLKRQLNEVEEEAARKDAQLRHAQRELAEERESSQRLQRQVLDQHLQLKRKESQLIKNTLKLDLSLDEEDDPTEVVSKDTNESI
ncbi:uncharacterized protein LOC134100642 isoform X2 [Sardina pilchardus]|uniref:uncharacterized protein LOC134100642 isoform X2 n=1 Tax=Sardina pilchardus TaxID=27697 RepID=UPI002E116090